MLWEKASNPKFVRVKPEEYIKGSEVREINSSMRKEATYLPKIIIYQALGLAHQSSASDYGKMTITQT